MADTCLWTGGPAGSADTPDDWTLERVRQHAFATRKERLPGGLTRRVLVDPIGMAIKHGLVEGRMHCMAITPQDDGSWTMTFGGLNHSLPGGCKTRQTVDGALTVGSVWGGFVEDGGW